MLSLMRTREPKGANDQPWSFAKSETCWPTHGRGTAAVARAECAAYVGYVDMSISFGNVVCRPNTERCVTQHTTTMACTAESAMPPDGRRSSIVIGAGNDSAYPGVRIGIEIETGRLIAKKLPGNQARLLHLPCITSLQQHRQRTLVLLVQGLCLCESLDVLGVRLSDFLLSFLDSDVL